MGQRKSTSEDQSDAASPPPWVHRATQSAPDWRARMLEHMARTRSASKPQAVTAAKPSRRNGWDILHDVFGYAIVFGVIALIFQSRLPFYLGAFLFLTDGERIERALGTIGIRFEPGAIGPHIIKGFVSLFGWFALLASLRGSVPVWLAAWMPPAETSWSFIVAIALAFAIIEAVATLAIRRTLPWLGWEIRPDSVTWTTIRFVVPIGALALLVLLGRF